MARYGGIDLGGTKIQAVVVDEQHEVLGSSRLPTPTTGGPADVALAMVAAVREASEQAGVGPGRPHRRRRRLAGRRRRRRGHRHERAQPARLGGLATRWRRSSRPRWPRRSRSPTTSTSPPMAEFELGAAQAVPLPARRLLGHGRRRRDRARRRAVRGPRRRGRDRPRRRQERRPQCPCGRIGCMEAYAGRGAMEVRAREKVADGEKTVLFEIMEEKGKPRLSSGIWERALERDDKLAHHLIDQAVEALGVGIASSLNLLDVEAVVIGGGLGLRLGEPVRGEDPRGRHAAPVRRPPPAGDPARLARRPRRRDRRDAARRGQDARGRLARRSPDQPHGRPDARARPCRPRRGPVAAVRVTRSTVTGLSVMSPRASKREVAEQPVPDARREQRVEQRRARAVGAGERVEHHLGGLGGVDARTAPPAGPAASRRSAARTPRPRAGARS